MRDQALFCYGTLRHPAIMAAVAGADLPQVPALLSGYACCCLRGEVFPGLLASPGEQVEGVLYRGLSAAHLQRLDAYEGDWYERRLLTVSLDAEQQDAWVYLLSPAGQRFLEPQPWSYAPFLEQHLAAYLKSL